MSKTALEKIVELKSKRIEATQKFLKRTLWHTLGAIVVVCIIGLPVTFGCIYVLKAFERGDFLQWATFACAFILGVGLLGGIVSLIIEGCSRAEMNKK